MVRWHLNSCENPSIIISPTDLEPRCKSCGASPPLAALRNHGIDNPPLIPTPMDEPLGQLNLYWPAIIHYEDMDSYVYAPSPKQESLRTTPSEHVTQTQSYDQVLRERDIRLLHLSPSPYEGAPIHLTLDVFPKNESPEYEAVSYTWGGEDGDNAPAFPVYVGPFWDVLLQTRNCYSMLRYLRRKDRLRTLWVDAICINQQNASEKATQIPCMGDVYKHAMRVMVYLGSSLGQHRQFPARESIATLPRDTLGEMLQARYFTRLWVIQELILAPSIVFIFREVECHAHQSAISQCSLPKEPVPWLKHLGAQFFDGESRLIDIFRLTSQSSSADIRDKLFGILGLLRWNTSKNLSPDYTLSVVHFRIGVFAYCVIEEDQAGEVLANAIGVKGWGQQPSWVPDWPLHKGMALPRHAPGDDNRMLSFKFIDKELAREARRRGLLPVSWGGSTGLHRESYPNLCRVGSHRPSVNKADGSLSLQLVHFSSIRAPLEKIAIQDTSSGYLFRVRGIECDLFLLGYDAHLANLAKPGSDHIFYLGPGIPLLLRKISESSENYKIIAPLKTVLILPPGVDKDYYCRIDTYLAINALIHYDMLKSLESSFPTLGSSQGIMDPFSERNNPRPARLRSTRTSKRILHQIFPGASTVSDTIKAIQIIPQIELLERNAQQIHDKTGTLKRFLSEVENINHLFSAYEDIPPIMRAIEKFVISPGEYEHVEFAFSRNHFSYVRKWYIDPLFSEAEDPTGSLSREENRLYWGDTPMWEWRQSADDDWLPVVNSLDLKIIVEERLVDKIYLRTRSADIIRHLQKNCWETEVLRRVWFACEEVWMKARAKGDTSRDFSPMDLLSSYIDESRREQGASESRAINWEPIEGPIYWHPSALREHNIDGKYMLVKIF